MSEWCQNKECCYKKNQSQIRGTKGNKHYQSNKASKWYEYWCSTGCRDQWFKDNATTCINAVGIIGKQIVGVKDSWQFSADYNYDHTNGSNHDYFLTNKLMGVKQVITEEQAQTPEQLREGSAWYSTKPDSEAKPLAIELGLVKDVA
tara:strand:+ start:54 stop:494 length:441 start_codon:yes stop_codon:yes gene_type:complete